MPGCLLLLKLLIEPGQRLLSFKQALIRLPALLLQGGNDPGDPVALLLHFVQGLRPDVFLAFQVEDLAGQLGIPDPDLLKHGVKLSRFGLDLCPLSKKFYLLPVLFIDRGLYLADRCQELFMLPAQLFRLTYQRPGILFKRLFSLGLLIEHFPASLELPVDRSHALFPSAGFLQRLFFLLPEQFDLMLIGSLFKLGG